MFVASLQELCALPEAREHILEQLLAVGRAGKLKGFELVRAIHIGTGMRRPAFTHVCFGGTQCTPCTQRGTVAQDEVCMQLSIIRSLRVAAGPVDPPALQQQVSCENFIPQASSGMCTRPDTFATVA